MRKFRLFSLIITLFVFGFAVGAAKAQDEMPPEDPRPPMGQKPRPNLLQELNLSREQIQQIRRINQARRPLMQEAQMRFRQANRALDEAIYADSPNEADIQARMKDVQLAQAEVIKIRTQSEYAIRKVLTPEQLVKFRELRERFMRRMQQNQQNAPPQGEEPNQREVNNPNRQNLNPLPRRRRGF
ncbi:MAG TPA: Spy/CpxP family protein refolding chaperone [Pyrinomonadaceae bacterium]|jgi:Spy/CpxP family protein refolding chaperone